MPASHVTRPPPSDHTILHTPDRRLGCATHVGPTDRPLPPYYELRRNDFFAYSAGTDRSGSNSCACAPAAAYGPDMVEVYAPASVSNARISVSFAGATTLSQSARKARPDHLAGPGVSVDLGEDVAKDVAHREEQHPGTEGHVKAESPDRRHLRGADEVRAQEHRDECCHEEVVVAVDATRGSSGIAHAALFRGFEKGGGGRCRIRTYDFHRVKVALYR